MTTATPGAAGNARLTRSARTYWAAGMACWIFCAEDDYPGSARVDGHDKLTLAIPPMARILKHAGGCSTGVRHAVPVRQDAASARPPKIR